MRHPRSWETRLWIALALGLAYGLAGEGLAFAWAQCGRVEDSLAADFKILALVSQPLDDAHQKILRETFLSQPGVFDAQYVSKDRALDSLAGKDPEVTRAVSLLGDNPLPAAFEVRLTAEGIAALPQWAAQARALPGISDLQYRPGQAQAVLQARADRLYLAVLMGLGFWVLVIVSVFFLVPGLSDPVRMLQQLWESAPLMVWGAAGTALGSGTALALVLPTQADSPFWTWPPLKAQGAILLAGALGGWLTDRLLP